MDIPASGVRGHLGHFKAEHPMHYVGIACCRQAGHPKALPHDCSCLSSPSSSRGRHAAGICGSLVDGTSEACPSASLTIMAKEAHGLRKGPPWSGVGGVAPVVHSKGCRVLRVGQVLEELPHCLGPQHPLQTKTCLSKVRSTWKRRKVVPQHMGPPAREPGLKLHIKQQDAMQQGRTAHKQPQGK